MYAFTKAGFEQSEPFPWLLNFREMVKTILYAADHKAGYRKTEFVLNLFYAKIPKLQNITYP